MSFLDDILRRIKNATLDKTNIDEKIGGAVSSAFGKVKSAFTPEPLHSPIPTTPLPVRPTATPRQPIIRPQAPQPPSAVKRLSDVMGKVTAAPYNITKDIVQNTPKMAKSLWDNLAARQYGENVGKAITRPVDFINESRMNKSDLSEAQKMTNVATRLQKMGRVEEAQALFERSRNLSKGVVNRATQFKAKNKELQKKIVETGIKTELSLGGAGYTAANPSLLVGGAVIPAVIAKITGEDPYKAAGKGAAEALPYSGVMQFTTPAVNIFGQELTKRLGPFVNNPAFRAVIERGLVGAGNVVENRVINKVTNQDNSAGADIFAFTLGALVHKPGKTIDGWADLPEATRTSIIRMANAAGLDTSPQAWAGDIKWKGAPKFLDDLRFSLKKDGLLKTVSENANLGLNVKVKGGNEAIMKAEEVKPTTKAHIMPSGEVMAGPEHAGAVPGSEVTQNATIPGQTPVTRGNVGHLSKYTPAKNLPPEQKAIEEKFANELKTNFDGAVAEYKNRFGNVLNTDNARELSPEYNNSNAAKSKYSAAVHEPASAFVKEIYERELATPDPKGINNVIFTAGGTGAGKTTAIADVPETARMMRDAQIVYDTNMNHYDSAKQKIDMALKAGKEVSILYVHRDPLESFADGAVKRALRIGRTVPLEEHVNTHAGAVETVKKLAQTYKNNPNVEIRIINNSYGKGNAKIEPIDSINKVRYNKDVLRGQISRNLDLLYENKQIPEEIYQGFRGSQTIPQGANGQNGTGGSPKPQSENLSRITPEDRNLSLEALFRSRGYGPSDGGRVPTNEEVAMNALNKSRKLSEVMATKPAETKLPLQPAAPPTKISEVLQTGRPPTTPVQTQSKVQTPNIAKELNQPSDTIIAEGRKEIGRANEQEKSLGKTVNDLYTQWVDRYNPITKAADFAKKILKGKGAELRPEYDPSVLVRRLTGAGGIADARFNEELKPIIDEADKLKIDKTDLDVYLKARRDVGFGSVNREITGSDPVVAQQRIDALKSKYGDSIDAIANKLYEYQNKGFQEMVDAGFLSKESADLIRQQNPDYVPFYRVMDEVNDYLGLPTRKTMQGTQPIKKIKGSEKMIESPVESIIGNTFSQRAAIEKNRVAKAIVGLQQMAPDLGFERSATSGNDTITVWNNGEKQYWRVGTDIADTAKGLNEENMNALLKIFRAPASLLRQGATGRNPEFMIPNIVRDQLDAGITSKYGYVPFVDYLSGLKSILTNDETYQRWERSGAKIDLGEMSGKKSIQKYFDEKGARKGLFSWLSAGLDVMGKYSEQPTRVGLFKKAYKATGNELLAMMESRDATVDFARMGSKMKVANSIIPFLNVGVQGFDKLIRSVKDHPGKVLTNGLIYGALPAITTTAYNLMFHPEEYAEIPQYEKDSNFVLVKGRNEKGTVDYVTIPKGNILPMISNPIESFMAFAAGESNQTLGEFASQFISSSLPVIGEGQSVKEIATKTIGSNLPQLIKPAAESLVNKSFYKYDPKKEQSKEIVPSYLQKREPYLQSYEWTPEMYKKIGAVFNVSPLQVQNLMEGYLAGYAKIPAQIVEGMKNISEGNEIPTNEKTIIRRFVKETYPSGSKPAAPVERTPFMERVMPKVGAAERGGSVEKPSETKIANEKYLLQSSKETARELGGGVYLIKKDNGDVETIDMSGDLTPPDLTGNDLLDKKLTSKYKGKITTRQNDVVDLYTAGLIDEKKAESMLEELTAISDKVSGKAAKASAKMLKELFKAAQEDVKDRASLREFLTTKPKGITSTLKKISSLTGMKQTSVQGSKSIQDILKKRRNQEPLYKGPQ